MWVLAVSDEFVQSIMRTLAQELEDRGVAYSRSGPDQLRVYFLESEWFDYNVRTEMFQKSGNLAVSSEIGPVSFLDAIEMRVQADTTGCDR